MGTHPIFESDFDCLTDNGRRTMSDKAAKYQVPEFDIPKVDKDGNPLSKNEQKRLLKEMKKQKEQAEKAAKKAASAPAAAKKEAAEDSEDNLTPNQYNEIRKKKLREMRDAGV